MGDRRSDNDERRKSEKSNPDIRLLRDKYNIIDKYRKPAGFTDNESYHGDGKYPPDWGQNRQDITNAEGGRRQAALEYQDYTCGRCRVELLDSDYYNCHHYRPIGEGGTHEIQNLITLCIPCHKLIHPTIDDLDGDWREAPMFPAPDADLRVATIRKPATAAEKEQYLPEMELLELTSTVGENTFATSEATYSTSPTDSIEAARDLDNLLSNVGLTPDKQLVVNVINEEHSPLRDAKVELELDLGQHGSYTVEQTTDKYGEAQFIIPEPSAAVATVSKDEFETTDSEIPVDNEPYEGTVKIRLANTIAATGAATSKKAESSSTSRRGLLMLGAGALGGVALYDYLWGTRSDNTGQTGAPVNDAGQTETEIPSETGLPALDESWSIDTGTSAEIQSIKTVDSQSYITTKTGTVVSLSPDGNERWTANLEAESTEPLSIANDLVVVSAQNKIQALDPDTGEVQWMFQPSSNQMPLITASENSIISILQNEEKEITEMVSIDAGSGDENWRTEVEGYRRAVAASGMIYLPVGNDGIRIYNQRGEVDGDVQFPKRPSRSGRLTVEGARGYIIAGETSQFGYDEDIDLDLHAFDLGSKVHLWQTDVVGSDDADIELPSPSVAEGTILNGISRNINSIDNSGVEQWNTAIEGGITSVSSMTNDRVYVGVRSADEHFIQALDISSGDLLSETPVNHTITSSTVVGTGLLAGTSRGVIRKFDNSV